MGFTALMAIPVYLIAELPNWQIAELLILLCLDLRLLNCHEEA